MTRSQKIFAGALTALLLTGLTVTAQAAEDGYAGTETCGSCHAAEVADWQGSHHDQSMMHASKESVVGDFNNQELTVHGVTSRFFMRDGKYFVNTDGPDGKMQDYEVAYTFGVEPLQQYLVEFPDGRVQALALAWDDRPAQAGGQRWYHLFPDEPLQGGDEMHWTGIQQNWNFMCADCHSTNLRKNYDQETDRFATSWSEINVGCESCHGPAAAHLDWAAKAPELQSEDITRGLALRFDDRKGVSWPINAETGIAERQGGAIGRKEIEMCAACHSRRELLAEGRESDPTFLNYHRPALLTQGLYHADGQIQDEVFVWGSYTQSKMHMAGVTCSDCHDPHSQELRAPGDSVCAQCHLPSVFASKDHHGHATDSAGASCLDCHMPAQTYMGVDDRRDHSMRIPRPDISRTIGAPDACSQCHSDLDQGQDQDWAAEAFAQLFPEPQPLYQNWTTAFHQAREGRPQAEVSLLGVLNRDATPPIVRATAVLELGNFLSPLSGQVVTQALFDESPLVRMAALQGLQQIPPASRYDVAGHLLRDPVLAVRTEAANTLAGTPLNQLSVQDRGALQLAMQDYYNIQQLNADRPESYFNLGNLSREAGNSAQAENYYREAIRRNPDFAPAYMNLADLYRNEGMTTESVKLLEEGITQAPDDAALHHSLGLALVREGSGPAAVEELREAVELAPDVERYVYVLGVALSSLAQGDEAVVVLESAQKQFPYSRDILFALATMERDRGNRAEALGWTEEMLKLNPTDQQAKQLSAQLQGDP